MNVLDAITHTFVAFFIEADATLLAFAFRIVAVGIFLAVDGQRVSAGGGARKVARSLGSGRRWKHCGWC